MTESDEAKILRTFINDEDAAFSRDEQGDYWPRHHHWITPLATKAGKWLGVEERKSFYFHFLRTNGVPPLVADAEIPLLVGAYRRLIPYIDASEHSRERAGKAKRIRLLFVFGFDGEGVLPGGVIVAASELKARLKALAQFGKYSYLEAQRGKKEKFQPYSGQGGYLLDVLRHLGLGSASLRRESPLVVATDDAYRLMFWGMVLTILMNGRIRGEFLREAFAVANVHPDRDSYLGILNDYVQCVLPDCGPDEAEFSQLAARLAEIEAARQAASEGALLARSLGLPFAEGERWHILIIVPLAGAEGSPSLSPNITLQITFQPDFPWDLHLAHPERGRYWETPKEVHRNDPGIAGLGRGNLVRFPEWLRMIREQYGIDYDLSAAEISCGRQRAAARRVAAWLER